MAAPARERPREAKPKRPRRARAPREYVVEDTTEAPEDEEAAATTLEAWLNTLPPG